MAPFALVGMAVVLVAIAGVSLRYQAKTWRRLRSESMASDDRRYHRGIFRRRTFNAVLMLGLAGLLAGGYLLGGWDELTRLTEVKRADLTDEDRDSLRNQTYYWMAVLGLLFLILVVAICDYWATTLYGRRELARIRAEQQTLLERDLAVHRQKLNDRAKRAQE